jgi:hypothetical protein
MNEGEKNAKKNLLHYIICIISLHVKFYSGSKFEGNDQRYYQRQSITGEDWGYPLYEIEPGHDFMDRKQSHHR